MSQLGSIWALIISLFSISVAHSASYDYMLKQYDGHKLHIVTLNPADYEIRFVKAHDQAQGRETVEAIANRNQANIAINGGFFQIGPEKDGVPSGTLITQGKVYSSRGKKNACLIQNDKTFSIAICGNIPIPPAATLSAVMGIPRLLTEGQINPILRQKKTPFYAQPHARTAVGLKPSGEMVLLVAEHSPFAELQLTNAGNLERAPLIVGLTLPDLAELMRSLGCNNAINLDGGGSSTLWLEGKTVNQTLGDEDEAMGPAVARPVSDAIIFKQK